MDILNKESIRKKTTSIPRLNKKISCESSYINEFQEDCNSLNRCSSDPNQHAYRTADQNISNILTKTKKLCKFTLNEKLKKGGNEEKNMSDNTELEDDSTQFNSGALNGEDRNKCVNHDTHKEVSEEEIHIDRLAERNHENTNLLASNGDVKTLNNVNMLVDNYHHQSEVKTCEMDTTNACPEISNSHQPSIPPLQLQNIQNQINEDAILRSQSLKQSLSLQEAYLKQVGSSSHQQQFDQCKWNVINPFYKNISLRRNLPKNMILNPSLVSDVDVKKLTHKEESSDVDSDDETVFKTAKSCRNDKTNSTLSRLYNSLENKQNKASLSKTNKKSGESLVNAFMEVFGDDSHIIQKLRSNRTIKCDDRFRKSNCRKNQNNLNDACSIQESPRDMLNYASRKLKLVQDLYKSDDVYSSITASSNDRSISELLSCKCSPRQGSIQSKSASCNMIKGCGCEIKHLQLNVVQKSIEDIHSTMKMMLDNLSPTTSEDIALELVKLRSSYDECLTYQRKISMQNKKLQNEVHDLCFAMYKILESNKKSGSKLKYFVLPILGAAVYFVVNHFDLCNKIPVSCDE